MDYHFCYIRFLRGPLPLTLSAETTIIAVGGPGNAAGVPVLRKNIQKRMGFTLVEIMLVAAMLALLALFAVPNFLRARKRSQSSHLLHDMRMIDSAIDQYTIENHKTAGDDVSWEDIKSYLKTGSKLYNSGGRDILGYAINDGSFTVDGVPRISSSTYNALSDVAPSDFWSPFY